MFRGKESSNRIELSRLVQDFLNFGVLGSLRLWGWGGRCMGVGGGWGYPLHTCTCMRMHAHACTCTHAHARVVNMIISCKWPPPLGEYLGIPYDVIHAYVRACVHVHVHVGEMHPLTTPHPHPPTPPPPRGGPPESIKIQ